MILVFNIITFIVVYKQIQFIVFFYFVVCFSADVRVPLHFIKTFDRRSTDLDIFSWNTQYTNTLSNQYTLLFSLSPTVIQKYHPLVVLRNSPSTSEATIACEIIYDVQLLFHNKDSKFSLKLARRIFYRFITRSSQSNITLIDIRWH